MSHRIVSLVASATEIVSALGFEDRLVGRSHECDHPPGVARLPARSASKVDVAASSRAIDDEVNAIAVMPCNFDGERAEREMAALAARPEWRRLSAVRAGRVAIADGNQYFNRPGPRLVESAEILAECLHPGRFDFGRRGRGWRRWAPPVPERRRTVRAPQRLEGAETGRVRAR